MRLFLFALLGTILFAGCAPSADPLDWKIEADDIDELNVWLRDTLPLLPDDLKAEVEASIGNIQSSLSEKGDVARALALCRRLDGRSVRFVVINGYEIGNDILTARIQNESEALLRLAQTADALPADQVERETAYHRARSAAYKKTLERAEQRLASLRAELQKQ